MKKYFIAASLLMGMAALNSCGNKNEDDANEPAAQEKGEKKDGEKTGLKIAYVDLDSISEHYDYQKDLEAEFQAKAEKSQKALMAKQQALQQHANAAQKKYETGQFQSQAEFERAQASLQKEQQDLAELDARLSNEFAQEQAESMKALTDSVQNFINDYNKNKKYDYVLVKSTALYCNPAYDITKEVIAGLNKRYKKAKK